MLRTALRTVPLLLFCAACSPDATERPPDYTGDSGGGFIGGGHSSGAGGANSGGSSDLGSDSQRGLLVSLSDDGFVNSSDYLQAGSVTVLSQTSSASQTVTYDGVAFEAQVDQDATYWVHAAATTDTTLLGSVTEQVPSGASWALPLLKKSILDELLANLNSPTSLRDGRGHLVITITDAAGAPISDVKPQVGGAPDLAFNNFGLWTDALDVTSDSGQFIAYNVLASDVPGDNYRVILTGSVDGEFPVRAVANAVTFYTFIVN